MKYYHENRKYNESFKMWCSLNTNFSFHAHYHNDIEIFSVIKGTAIVGINAEIFELSAGDTAFIVNHDIHYYSSPDENCESVILVAANDFFNSDEKNSLQTAIIKKTSPISEEIQRLMILTLSEATQRKIGCNLFCKSYVSLIASNILREDGNLLIVKKMLTHQASMERFQNILEYIDNNFDNKITLTEVSELIHYSPFYFSKFFKKLTGTNFIKYLNHKRISHAKRLIKETDMNITHISSACGFENIRTFNREFKTICNKTPSEYRLSQNR